MQKRLAVRSGLTASVIVPVLVGWLFSSQVALAAPSHWIVDQESGCGTTNSFAKPDERIRWFGSCQDGKLHGRGTLIWYQGNREIERNDGMFKDGEFHGTVVTAYPSGEVVTGQYSAGRRHGNFVIKSPNGRHIRAVYKNGQIKSQRLMSVEEVKAWSKKSYQRQIQRAKAPKPKTKGTKSPKEMHSSTYRYQGRQFEVFPSQPPKSPAPDNSGNSDGFFSDVMDSIGGGWQVCSPSVGTMRKI